jgi:hypothetical protein
MITPIDAHSFDDLFLFILLFQRSSFTGDSQWPARGYGDHDSTLGDRLSQDVSVDEETQLLDANG